MQLEILAQRIVRVSGRVALRGRQSLGLAGTARSTRAVVESRDVLQRLSAVSTALVGRERALTGSSDVNSARVVSHLEPKVAITRECVVGARVGHRT